MFRGAIERACFLRRWKGEYMLVLQRNMGEARRLSLRSCARRGLVIFLYGSPDIDEEQYPVRVVFAVCIYFDIPAPDRAAFLLPQTRFSSRR